MISNLLPFLMFGILLAALLARPLQRLLWISLPVALVIAGFVASEAWVAAGLDTGLRWQILSDLVFYLLLPILIFEAAITIDTRWLVRDGVLIGALSVPLLVVGSELLFPNPDQSQQILHQIGFGNARALTFKRLGRTGHYVMLERSSYTASVLLAFAVTADYEFQH